MSFFEESPGQLVIRRRPDIYVAGRWFLVIGGGLTLVCLAVGLLHEIGYLLAGGPALFALIGFVFWLVSGKIVIDLRAETVRLGGRDLHFREIVGVFLRTYMKTVHTQHGTQQHQIWQLAVVTSELDAEAVAELARLRAAVDAAFADPANQLTPESGAAVEKALEKWRPMIERAHCPVVESGDELGIWQLSERLAKLFDVPIVDFCGEAPAERTPAQLDLPLGTRMARSGVERTDPGPPPASVGVQEQSGELRLSWQGKRSGAIFVFVMIAAIFLGFAFYSGSEAPVLFYVLGALGLASLIPIPFVGRGHGSNVLRITGDEISHQTQFVFTHKKQMPLAKLEQVRVNSGDTSWLGLMSDDLIVRCLMDKDAATWMRAKLEHYLHGRPYS